MKKVLKNLVIMLFFIIIISIMFPQKINADAPKQKIVEDGASSSSESKSVSSEIGSVEVNTSAAESNISSLSNLVGKILGFLQVLSALVSVVVIAFTGFRYIIDDTPDFRKELKERMLPIVIGMVLVFGAVTITKFIFNVAS